MKTPTPKEYIVSRRKELSEEKAALLAKLGPINRDLASLNEMARVLKLTDADLEGRQNGSDKPLPPAERHRNAVLETIRLWPNLKAAEVHKKLPEEFLEYSPTTTRTHIGALKKAGAIVMDSNRYAAVPERDKT